MDFAKPTNTDPNEKPKAKRGFFSKLIRLFGFLLFLVLLVAAVAPMLLSTNFAREKVIEIVNKQIAPAIVKVDKWSFAWFGEQSLTGLSYADPTSGVSAQVKDVRVSALWDLVPIGKMALNMTIDSPTVTLDEPTMEPVVKKKDEAKEAVAKDSTFVLPALDLSMRFIVLNTTVRMRDMQEALVHKGDIEVVMEGLDQAITTKLNANLLDALVSAQATVPAVNQLLIAKNPADFLTAAEMNLSAPWATLKATASSPDQATYPEVSLDNTLYLPQLLERLQTLGITLQDVQMDTGTLVTQLKLVRGATPQTLLLTTSVNTHNLQGSYQKKALPLTTKVNLAAELQPDNLIASKVSNLSVEFPGLLATGNGSLEEGNFVAEINANTLLATLRPFMAKPIELTQPLAARITAKATQKSASIQANCTSQTTPVANLKMDAQGIDLATQSIAGLTLTSGADLQAVAPFIPDMPAKSLQGTVYCNATATGSFQKMNGNANFGLSNAQITTTTWNIAEASLLRGTCAFQYTLEKGIEIDNIQMTSPVFNLKGKASYQPTLSPAQATTINLEGMANVAYPFEHWRVYGADEKPTTFKGDVQLQLTAQPMTMEGLLPKLKMVVTAPELAILLPEKPAFALPLTMTVEAESASDDALALTQFIIDTPYVDITETKGTYTKDGILDLNGLLVVDFTTLWKQPFFNDLREKEIQIEGVSQQPFTFNAPLSGGAQGILNYGKAKAGLSFSTLSIPTLDIPYGGATVTLEEGVASLDLQVAINDGMIFLNPDVNVTAEPYVVTFPENAHVLQNMNISQQMLDEGMKFVSPILPGAASPTGKVNLIIPNFRMELGEDPVGSLKADLILRTTDFSIVPNEMMHTLIQLIGRQPSLEINDQDIEVSIEGNKLTTKDIALKLQDTHLYCQGTTNLTTQEVNYNIILPLTRELVGGSVVEHVEGEERNLILPITGTVNNPQIDLASLRNAMTSAATSLAKRKANEKVAEKLEKTDNKYTRRALEELQGILEGEGEVDTEGSLLSGEKLEAALNNLTKNAEEKAAQEESAKKSSSDDKKEKLKSTLRSLFN